MTDTKNVLFVIHYPFFGGPQNQALRTAGPLARRGVDLTVVLPEEPGNAAARLTAGGVNVVPIALHRVRASADLRLQARFLLGAPGEVQTLRRLIRERAIDVVQLGGLVNPHAAIAARCEGVGVVWQILDTRTPVPLRRLLMPWVRTLADVVMTTGIGLAHVHPGATALGRRLVPFYPPVDTSAFKPSSDGRTMARRELGVPEAAPLVGTVANLSPQKGLDHFVSVADALHMRDPGIRFLILGSAMETQPAYEARIRTLVQRSTVGRAGALRIVDPGQRVPDLLPALDLFLLTSVPHSEGISTTVLEAMSTGIPVVATDVGAISEVVLDHVTGRLVPALDDRAMADAAHKLLNDHRARGLMARGGRRRAVQLYDVEVCAETHMRAYQLALTRARHRRLGRTT